MRLRIGQRPVEAELDFHLDVLERDRLFLQRHDATARERDVVVVAPLVDAHLLAGEADARRRPLVHGLAAEKLVDGDRGLVPVGHGPDDVLGAEGRIASEEDVRQGGLEGLQVDDRHAPAIEVEAEVALDPGEGVLLADGDQDVVAGDELVRLAGRQELAPALLDRARLRPSRRGRRSAGPPRARRPSAPGNRGSGCPRAWHPPSPRARPSSRRSPNGPRP